MPGAILTINTAGQFLNIYPHIHRLVTGWGFLPSGGFESARAIDSKTVRELFEANVFSMLREKGLSSQEIVDKIGSSKHAGFDAWIGPSIPEVKEIVQIGIYTVRSPATSGRLLLDEEPMLRYYAKGTRPDRDFRALFEPESRTFGYLDWIARQTLHISVKGCQMTHYFAAYSNAHRGMEARGNSPRHPTGSPARATTEQEEHWIKARRKSWARLVQQVHESDSLLHECGGTLRVISVMTELTSYFPPHLQRSGSASRNPRVRTNQLTRIRVEAPSARRHRLAGQVRHHSFVPYPRIGGFVHLLNRASPTLSSRLGPVCVGAGRPCTG